MNTVQPLLTTTTRDTEAIANILARTPSGNITSSTSATFIAFSPDESSTFERLSSWVSKNKVVLIGSSIVIVAAGIGLYYFNQPPTTPVVKKATKKPKKKSKKNNQNKTPQSESNSVIEEIPDVDKDLSIEAIMNMTETEIAILPADVRSKYASKLKAAGNTSYAEKKIDQAVKYYTHAIRYKADPVYYCNRAACYGILNENEKVIQDCTNAIKLNKGYVKALVRRATAYEKIEKYSESLKDFTAASIIDNFSNETAGSAVERVLKKLAETKAAEMMKDRKPHLPSVTFTHAYFQAFRKKDMKSMPDVKEGSGDFYLNEGNKELRSHKYDEAQKSFQLAIDNETENLGEAYNMTGTFKFIQGNARGALEDLDMSLEYDPDSTNSYVKRASVHMELGNKEKSFEDFEKAIEKNPNDPDIYYHRGQIYFITGEYAKALADYTKSIELDPEFVFAHIQLGVAQYKNGSIASSMVTFRKTIKKFPDSPDVYNYYGELLMDQQKFSEAVEKFEHAMVLENRKQEQPLIMNVLPLINQALCVFQWKQDTKQAEELCKKALIIDENCDLAVATLSQLLLQQGRIEDSLKYFEKSAELARTEMELVNTLSYMEATKAQANFLREHPEYAHSIGQALRQ